LKEIKTKSAIKDIKALDKTADVSRRMKNAYIRTKDQAEQLGNDDNGNYVDDAGNSIREGAEIVIRKTGHTAGNYGKKAVKKIKERGASDVDDSRYHDSNSENVRHTPTSEAKEAVNQNVSQPGTKQVSKHNDIQPRAKETVRRKFALSKPSELAKRRFVQSRVKQRHTAAEEIQPSIQKTVQTQATQAGGESVGSITAQTVQRPLFQPAEKVAVQALHPSSTPGHTIRQAADTGVKSIRETSKDIVKTVQRSVKNGNKTVKEATKSTVKAAAKSIRITGHTTRAAVKTPQAVAKNAAKTTQAAQKAAQAARVAARAAVVSAKTAVKVMMAAIKAIIAAAKGLVVLITSGGWIAVLVILVICLTGLLLGSPFGVFYSNERSSGNTPVMTEVVGGLNEEFTFKIQRVQDENPHDILELSGSDSISSSQWREILAVYAVKVTADPENGMEVSTLDNAKVGILRGVFWDMNKIDYWIETIEHEETVTTTDEEGNKTTETVTTTETILHINITSRSHMDMIAEYGFRSDQVKMLDELMKDEYRQLFIQLIGN